MAYAILRTAKLKSMGEIGGSLAHNYRTRETPNADQSRTQLNEHRGGHSPDETMAAIRSRLPEKRRKDAVLCVEYLITASPDYFEGGEGRGDSYFASALDWLKERHGADNVVATTIHRDETSPHLVAYVVPLDDQGKLNAKQFLGGRAKLSQMQTDFAERVGRIHGLERGIEGSRARHTSIKQFYSALEKEPKHGVLTAKSLKPQVLEKRLLGKDKVETPNQHAERLTGYIKDWYDPVVKEASTARLERSRRLQAEKTAQGMAEELKPLRELTEGLSEGQFKRLMRLADEMRRENRLVQETERRVKALPGLLRKHGAVRTLAELATAAIKAAGDWRKVDWEPVEKQATLEIHDHGWSLHHALKTVLQHSPGKPSMTPERIELELRSVPDAPGKEQPPAPVLNKGKGYSH